MLLFVSYQYFTTVSVIQLVFREKIKNESEKTTFGLVYVTLLGFNAFYLVVAIG